MRRLEGGDDSDAEAITADVFVLSVLALL